MDHVPPQSFRAESTAALLDPLIDLLERLPIPMMLQTSTGRVITQNWVWRRQVGDLQDPGQLRQDVAVILEAMEGDAQGDSLDFWEARSDGSTGACRLSSATNTCICTCPMKTGQDRVWQFVKIPMGEASSLLEVLPGGQQPYQERPYSGEWAEDAIASSIPFKLATLNFYPDPAWRSLIKAESLWLVLAQDMTEQHQVAKELAAKNADLVQLNRLKDEFLACISHELKTPLTAVLGLSSLLNNPQLGALNERQSRYAQLIHQSGRHLILIVNDILDLTRIETGQLELTLDPVQIQQVCTRAYEQAQQLQVMEAAQQAKPEIELQFSLEIQPGLDSLIADELRLRQMLTNLFSNAIKFTEVEGQVGLRVEDWEGWIAFTIWDTGIGIPAEKQHLIFQKFQQLENPLTRRFDGTGLGLVLTQRLARLHGGDITFTSVEGQGSEFTLLLPPCPPQALRASLSPHDAEQVSLHEGKSANIITSENRLVLVVESAPQAIDSLTRHLTGLGYRVAIARSGTEALEKTRRLQPCVICLNPMLPLLSGWDVLTLLKADEATHSIPVVITAMRVEKDLAYQNGADGFLSLPVQGVALEQCLEELVRHSVAAVNPLENLTVLHLRGQSSCERRSAAAPANADINQLLHPYRCRVLEVDELEQADLLARVWKPDFVLIDGEFFEPLALIKELRQSPFLAPLPLVTLTPEITQAANQIPGLSVFPCFAEMKAIATPNSENLAKPAETSDVSALLQVIQVAVGVHWKPHILIADFSTLEEDWIDLFASNISPLEPATEAPDLAKASSGLRALVQYFHTAGFRSSVGNSWQSIFQQLQHQSVDLLLFYVHTFKPNALFARMTEDLEKLAVKPPTLVWHCHACSDESDPAEGREFAAVWGAIATQILSPCLSMTDLLTEVNQVLAQQRRG